MNIPDDLRYSSDHEWIRRDGDVITIGITDYAQDSLGDVVFVEQPEVGQSVAASDTFTEVESTKSVSDIYAPVSGTITEVNGALEDQPELLELRSVRRRLDLPDRDVRPGAVRRVARRRRLPPTHRRLTPST